MDSPVSSESSGGGAPLKSELKSELNSDNGSSSGGSPHTRTESTMNANANAQALVPYLLGGGPGGATFDDVRQACQQAQAHIMRLQQVSNNQVGLPAAVRDLMFDELRMVGQCFITALGASTKIEQMTNTERAQLQGALSAALHERGVAFSERDTVVQEVNILRERLRAQRQGPNTETKGPGGTVAANGDNYKKSLKAKCESWIVEQEKSEVAGPMPADAPAPYHALDTVPYSTRDYALGRATTPPSRQGMRPPSSQQLPAEMAGGRNDMGRQMGLLNYGSPGLADPFKPVITPLAHKMYPPSIMRADPQNYKGYGALADPSPNHRSQHFASTPAGYPRNNFGRSDSASSGAWSSLHPSASASNVGPRPQYMGMPPPPPPPPPPQQQQFPVQHLLAAAAVPAQDLSGVTPFGQIQPDCGNTVLGPADQKWNAEFFEVFTMVKGWANLHCTKVDVEATRNLSRKAPKLWDYICQITYPNNRANAVNHASFLLNDANIRPYFVTRLLVQYIVQQTWDPKAWEGHDDGLTHMLQDIRGQLDRSHGFDAVLNPQKRFELADRRASGVQDFLNHNVFHRVRSQIVNANVNRFKDIVGPLMTSTGDRVAASNELYVISERALHVSALLNTSTLSFQFIFNDCGIKFSEQSHKPLNSHLHPRELQNKHWRLMVVITPGITYRNDAGVSVDPRFISKANVLVMQ